jgi:O-antigen/teichoic acid export membrane protein
MLRQFLRDSVLYGAASIFTRSIALLLVPLYTRVLVPADYGVVDILTVVTSFALVIVALEIAQAVARYFPDSKDPDRRTIYASTSLWFSVGAYSLFLIIAIAFAEPISAWLLQDASLADVFRASAVATWFTGLFYLVQSQLRYSLRPRRYVAASLTFSLASMATSVVFVLVLQQGVIGVVYGLVAGGAIGLAVALWCSRDVYRFRFEKRSLREMLRFSVPLVPSSVAVIVTLYIDRIVIGQLMSLGDVGLFGIGYRLASLSNLLMVGFVSALTPLVYTHYREPGTPRELARIFRVFVAFGLLFCLGLALFAADILAVVTTPQYVAGAIIVPLMAPAMLLAGMYIFAPGLGIEKKTTVIAGINIAAAVMNVILNVALVPVLGIQGAALATFLSSATIFGATMIASQRLYPVPHDWRRLGLAVAGTVALYAVGEALSPTVWPGLVIRGGMIALAALWLVRVGLVEPAEIRRSIAGLRGLIRPASAPEVELDREAKP